MFISVMLNVLTITTDYSYSIVKLNEIQAIELVALDEKVGGTLSITLKGDKTDNLIYSETGENWEKVVEWFKSNTLNLQSEMSEKDIEPPF